MERNPEQDARRPRTLILPPAPYAAAMLGGWWLDHQLLAMPLDLGAAMIPLGWSAVVLGLALFAWTMWTFVRHRTTVNPYAGASALCTSGPFRFSRNPIYLGDWFILLGVSLLLGTVWPLLFAPLIWAMLRFGVIRHEEAHLEAKFGADYRAYKTRVRRWI
ncbi:MAG: isoprenylcysteine carboxylmethyltransferase family protein [Thiobacillus sp.]|jgi:protein-S-isoprenylcysteine O-methyltransferase Ste14|nr:isoprenylcysteine carboxylmethyltransferase family protein [Thiobacillus sp.]